MFKPLFQSEPELRGALVRLADAARGALEAMSPQQRAYAFPEFPCGACGPASELIGRIVLEKTEHEGLYVCGTGHPELRPEQSHAWIEVGGYIVDLTHDQFPGTGLDGWVFERSLWHAQFEPQPQALCLLPNQWMQYPYAAYAAMRRACDLVE